MLPPTWHVHGLMLDMKWPFVSGRGSYNELLRRHKVEVIDIPEASGWRKTPNSAGALLRVALRYRPDIIHAHMMSSAVVGFVVSKAVRATLVTTMHTSFDRHSVLMITLSGLHKAQGCRM
jgi:hypothetical protein